jgi:4-amino-4-deoxy-L-arabinose transferase-like glycosyltransferase
MAVTLPWYAAVQWSNPEFFRFFILEHNLARFSQDVYHHRQPFWFYLPVFLLATMPWGLVLLVAVGQRVRLMWSEGREALASAEDSWALFLLIWMVVPIVFFSASQSKLPGYILPAVPAAALLVAEYLAGKVSTADGLAGSRRSKDGSKLPFALAAGHALVCGLLVFAAFSAGSLAVNRRLPWGRTIYFPAAMGFIIALVIGVVLVSRAGPRLITRATLFAVVVSVAAVVRVAAPGIDATQSARQIAESVESFSREKVPIAGYHLKREQEYGLEFYLNRGVESYDGGNIPAAAHVLVAKQNTGLQAAQLVPGRRVSFLTSVPAQKLDLFWVGEGPVSGAGR